MQRIIVPTDLSEYSYYAIASAQKIAHKSGGSVTLLYIKSKGEDEAMAREKLDDFLTERALDDMADNHMISDGDEVDAIITAGGDLIVMGSKGAKGLKSFFIGTNAEKVAKRAMCPVVIVKETADLDDVKSIIFPTDMRTEQEQIIADLKALQAFYGAHLHLVKVYDDAVIKRRTVESRLREFAEKYGLTSYSVTGRSGVSEAIEIMDFATEMGADLIAIGTHERVGPEKLVGGFITASVINKSKTPIWAKTIRNEE